MAASASSTSAYRHRGSRSSSVWRGRVWVITIFLVLRLEETWYYFNTAEYARFEELGHEAPYIILTTAFLIGMWCRQNWARYLFVILMLLRLGATSIVIFPSFDAMRLNLSLTIRLLSGPLLFAGVAAAGIYQRDIQRLVSRKR